VAQPLVLETGCSDCKRTPDSFELSKIQAKSL